MLQVGGGRTSENMATEKAYVFVFLFFSEKKTISTLLMILFPLEYRPVIHFSWYAF